MRLKTSIITGLAGIAIMAATPAFAASKTLDDIKARGSLSCAISTGLAGFAAPDDKGVWRGFDIDLCRGIATAIFNDPSKVKYTPTTGKTRFTVLRSGEVDVITRNSTWTFNRDVDLGFDFKGINYYDGQAFMVKKSLGVTSALDLDGATICVQTGSATELNLADFFRFNSMTFQPVITEDSAESRLNFEKGACDVYTTDASQLAAQRSAMQDPDAFMILPEIISKEPLGPVVRHGDNQWGDIVLWTLNTLIVAEELGVNSKNVDDLAKNAKSPEVRRLLGLEGSLGTKLGLSDDWAANVIRAVGNYGEIFERHIGVNTPIGLERGLNALWNRGGLLYAAPFR